MDKPSIKQLEYFLAVVEHGSIRLAADRMSITQPTLTAQIARLEDILRVKLFERARTGSTLSPAGRNLVPYARRILEEMQSMVDAAGSVQAGTYGTYRLGVSPTLGPYLLPRLLTTLHKRHPDLKFHVRESAPHDLEVGLLNGEFDLALLPFPINSQELVRQVIMSEPIRLVMSAEHPLASIETITTDDLRGCKVLTIESTHQYAVQIERLCEKFGAEVLRDYVGTSLDALRAMVVMEVGVAFLPALYIESEISVESSLVVKDLPDDALIRAHALAWRPTSPSRVFFARLTNEIRNYLRRDFVPPLEVPED